MTAPLDPRDDPDRYRPDAPDDPSIVPGLRSGRTAPLDPAQDPDRFTPPGQGQSLTDLLGKERAHEEERDGYQWVLGLLAVLGFLALVAFLFTSVLTP